MRNILYYILLADQDIIHNYNFLKYAKADDILHCIGIDSLYCGKWRKLCCAMTLTLIRQCPMSKSPSYFHVLQMLKFQVEGLFFKLSLIYKNNFDGSMY